MLTDDFGQRNGGFDPRPVALPLRCRRELGHHDRPMLQRLGRREISLNPFSRLGDIRSRQFMIGCDLADIDMQTVRHKSISEWRHGKRHFRDLTDAGAATTGGFPDEEGQQRAGAAKPISIDEVQLLGVGEASRSLHEPETEKTDIEIDIGLNVGRDACKVM